MGGQPFLALNVAALPPNLPTEISAEILRGGAEKVREAGVVLAGGHTVQDKEPKFGLMVLGFVHPERILSKGGARPGDVLLLSKPLGFGVITTALKREQVDPAHLAEAVSWMKRLNKTAAELAGEFGLHGGTDVTGFSLLGHACEVANASAVRLRFFYDRLPFASGAWDYAQQWVFPGGAFDNRLYYGSQVHFAPQIDEASQLLLFDPQTSGGLLLCVPADRLEALLQRAETVGQPLWVVGEVIEGQGIEVVDRHA
jgi:selenide,water dikinase